MFSDEQEFTVIDFGYTRNSCFFAISKLEYLTLVCDYLCLEQYVTLNNTGEDSSSSANIFKIKIYVWKPYVTQTPKLFWSVLIFLDYTFKAFFKISRVALIVNKWSHLCYTTYMSLYKKIEGKIVCACNRTPILSLVNDHNLPKIATQLIFTNCNLDGTQKIYTTVFHSSAVKKSLKMVFNFFGVFCYILLGQPWNAILKNINFIIK